MKAKTVESTHRVFTVPNLLSALRIVLIVAFFILFDSRATLLENWPALVCLALNALTDLLDGRLARALHQISEVGKILDPAADYLTKFFLILCFVTKYVYLLGFMLLFLARILIISLTGLVTVRQVGKNDGAIMAGKVDTVVFYVVMVSLVLFPGMPLPLAYSLVIISSVMMILAVVFYLLHFYRLRRAADASSGKRPT